MTNLRIILCLLLATQGCSQLDDFSSTDHMSDFIVNGAMLELDYVPSCSECDDNVAINPVFGSIYFTAQGSDGDGKSTFTCRLSNSRSTTSQNPYNCETSVDIFKDEIVLTSTVGSFRITSSTVRPSSKIDREGLELTELEDDLYDAVSLVSGQLIFQESPTSSEASFRYYGMIGAAEDVRAFPALNRSVPELGGGTGGEGGEFGGSGTGGEGGEFGGSGTGGEGGEFVEPTPIGSESPNSCSNPVMLPSPGTATLLSFNGEPSTLETECGGGFGPEYVFLVGNQCSEGCCAAVYVQSSEPIYPALSLWADQLGGSCGIPFNCSEPGDEGTFLSFSNPSALSPFAYLVVDTTTFSSEVVVGQVVLEIMEGSCE